MASKVVLVTGTSTGIGAACVARQAQAGWKVYAGVRRKEDGEQLVDAIDGDVEPVILDVTSRDDMDTVLARIETEVGSLDGLVNNAGIGVGGPVELTPEEDWRWQFDVNFFSAVELTRRAMPLVEKANGRFVHVGSTAGRIAAPGLGPYAASKHALEGFNWALRGELSRHTKMRSSVVCPGEVKTAIWDKGKQAVEEIAVTVDEAGRRDRYGFLVDTQRGFMAEGAARGVDPDRVAKAIEKALTARWPRARYLVGPDAQVLGVLARGPDRLREAFLTAYGRRLERAGRAMAEN